MAYLSYLFHFVFRTKRSERTIFPESAPRLYNYISGIANGLGCNIIKINGMPDHIHIAVEMSPTLAPAVFIREVKSRSSHWLTENKNILPYFDGWGKSYFGSTFSEKDKSKVIAYIDNQQEHHKTRNLNDEISMFFELANIPKKSEYFLND